jgi:hypothetical protein
MTFVEKKKKYSGDTTYRSKSCGYECVVWEYRPGSWTFVIHHDSGTESYSSMWNSLVLNSQSYAMNKCEETVKEMINKRKGEENEIKTK